MRLRHQHLPAVEADSGAHGGDEDDTRLHEAPNHLHPLGADDTLRAGHDTVRAHDGAHADSRGSGRRGSDIFQRRNHGEHLHPCATARVFPIFSMVVRAPLLMESNSRVSRFSTLATSDYRWKHMRPVRQLAEPSAGHGMTDCMRPTRDSNSPTRRPLSSTCSMRTGAGSGGTLSLRRERDVTQPTNVPVLPSSERSSRWSQDVAKAQSASHADAMLAHHAR